MGEEVSPSTGLPRQFHIVDYVVFIATFLISISIGVFFAIRNHRKNTTDEYLMGGRKMSLLPVAVSMCVSVLSGTTLLGAPAEMYNYGIMYEFVCIPIFLASVIVAVWFVPMFYPLKITSINKYLLLRFNSKTVQLLGTGLQFILQIMYNGCVIFAPAIAVEAMTGIPAWASIILMGSIGTAYTTMGGMKAVIWTDLFQSFVMLAGLLAIIIQGSNLVGGFQNVWKSNYENGRLNVNFSAHLTDHLTLYSLVFGHGAFYVAVFGLCQTSIQRYCGMSSVTKAKMAVLLTGPGFIIFKSLSMMVGMVAFAFYQFKGCDPLAAGHIENANQITPYFVMDILHVPGLPGLFASGIFSGSMSTLSSSVNSLAALFWEDIISDYFRDFSEGKKTTAIKCLAICFGIISTAMAYLVMLVGGNLIQVSHLLTGAILGPLLGLFVLSGMYPWANWLGVTIGTLVGLGVNLWLVIGQTLLSHHRQRLPTTTYGCLFMNETVTQVYNFTDIWSTQTPESHQQEMTILSSLYSLSFSWFALIGCLISIVMGMAISSISGKGKARNRLLFSCISYFRNEYEQERSGTEITSADIKDHLLDTTAV